MTSGDNCMYEAVIEGEVHRCAVGCLLGPKTLAQTIEVHLESDDFAQSGKFVALRDFNGGLASLVEAGYALPEFEGCDHAFLDECQYLHDDDNNWKNGVFDVTRLDDTARVFGLEVVVDEPEGAPLAEGNAVVLVG